MLLLNKLLFSTASDLMLEILSRGEIGYILYPEYTDGEVKQWIEENIKSGELVEIFKNWDFIGYTFLEIR